MTNPLAALNKPAGVEKKSLLAWKMKPPKIKRLLKEFGRSRHLISLTTSNTRKLTKKKLAKTKKRSLESEKETEDRQNNKAVTISTNGYCQDMDL